MGNSKNLQGPQLGKRIKTLHLRAIRNRQLPKPMDTGDRRQIDGAHLRKVQHLDAKTPTDESKSLVVGSDHVCGVSVLRRIHGLHIADLTVNDGHRHSLPRPVHPREHRPEGCEYSPMMHVSDRSRKGGRLPTKRAPERRRPHLVAGQHTVPVARLERLPPEVVHTQASTDPPPDSVDAPDRATREDAEREATELHGSRERDATVARETRCGTGVTRSDMGAAEGPLGAPTTTGSSS